MKMFIFQLWTQNDIYIVNRQSDKTLTDSGKNRTLCSSRYVANSSMLHHYSSYKYHSFSSYRS